MLNSDPLLRTGIKISQNTFQVTRWHMLYVYKFLRPIVPELYYPTYGKLITDVRYVLPVTLQRDSKRWTQIRTSIFLELYMVCE